MKDLEKLQLPLTPKQVVQRLVSLLRYIVRNVFVNYGPKVRTSLEPSSALQAL